MWKNIQPGRPQMTVHCMHITCWIPKATKTQWENVICNGFSSATMVAGMRLNVNVIRTLPLLLSLSLLHNEMHFWIYTMIFGISTVASFFHFVVKHTYFGNTMSNCGAGTLESMKKRYCAQIINSFCIIFPFLLAKRWIVGKIGSIHIVRNIQTDW
jgi:hypothetical protein